MRSNQTTKPHARNALRRFFAIPLAAVLLTTFVYLRTPPKVEAISLGIVISQVYGGAGCGTAGCSTYQNDYIELYNRSKTAVTCTNCSVQYAAATGTAWQVTALPATLTLQPGQYYLVAESFGANGVSPLPAPDTTGTIAMSATAAKVAVVNSTTALSGACPTLNGPGSPAVLDFIGYGATANCSETAVAAAPSTTTADTRAAGGNTDTDNNSTDFSALTPTPHNTASTRNTPTAANGVVAGRIATADGLPVAGVVVNLSGSQMRKTITDALGNYHFDDVETSGFYAVSPEQANFSFSPATRSFSMIGNSTEATFIAAPVAAGNPLDTPEYFVRQHYLDFLGREPDESGFNFWSDQVLSCGADAGCRERRAINVSAAYFLSIEFQQTGGLVDGLYRATYGRAPRFAEFMPDTQSLARGVVVGQGDWAARLTANKQLFISAWVERPEFRVAYEGATNEAFVARVLAHAQVSFSPEESAAFVSGLDSGTLTRLQMLAQIVADERFAAARRNEAFVMMEYFGYLRRDPDQSGYDFWLRKLNDFGGNFEQAEMVKAFINSGEYRSRFGH
ncbi:MAG: uncharacterized protein QOJ88_1148 [Pyrinomonadaceae bacterium]|jgi:hypothetical protein|nr:uncharacterized protein [Pyrinomonadaceae bacterium]